LCRPGVQWPPCPDVYNANWFGALLLFCCNQRAFTEKYMRLCFVREEN